MNQPQPITCPAPGCTWTQPTTIPEQYNGDRLTELLPHLDEAHAEPADCTDVEQLLARVRQLEAERALYVGVEPTIAEEMAELSRRLDAVDAVLTQWNEHCVGPQTRSLLDDVRAAANGETPTAT
ncbi:hypothetical protein [Kitasatospora sp. NPDC001132]